MSSTGRVVTVVAKGKREARRQLKKPFAPARMQPTPPRDRRRDARWTMLGDNATLNFLSTRTYLYL